MWELKCGPKPHCRTGPAQDATAARRRRRYLSCPRVLASLLRFTRGNGNLQFCISLRFTHFIQLQLHSRFAWKHMNDALKPCLEMPLGNMVLSGANSEPRKAHGEEVRFPVEGAKPRYHLLTNSGWPWGGDGILCVRPSPWCPIHGKCSHELLGSEVRTKEKPEAMESFMGSLL